MQSYVFIGRGLDGLSMWLQLHETNVHAVVVVSSPLRRAAMAILRAILKTPTRWRRLSVNPILQNRYPIIVKCLNIRENIGKSVYRSISRQHCHQLLTLMPFQISFKISSFVFQRINMFDRIFIFWWNTPSNHCYKILFLQITCAVRYRLPVNC